MSGRWTRYVRGDQTTLTESRKNALNMRVYVGVWTYFAGSAMIKSTTTMKTKRLENRIYIALRPTVLFACS